jgi:hypothetical protein
MISIERNVGGMIKTGAAIHLKYDFYYKDELGAVANSALHVSSVDILRWDRRKKKVVAINPAVKIPNG